MKKLFLFFGLIPAVALASNVFLTEVTTPYELVSIDADIDEPQLHLGELDNFPVMYEFSLSTTTDFEARISQPSISDPNLLSLLLVKVEARGGGVSEVMRLTSKKDDWSKVKDRSIGATFLDGGEISTELQAGVYRIEVSTPDNVSQYLLRFGPPARDGYFASLSKAWTVQQFLGYSPIRMLTSSLVYYPLGIIVLGFLIHRTWKYRKLISNAN